MSVRRSESPSNFTSTFRDSVSDQSTETGRSFRSNRTPRTGHKGQGERTAGHESVVHHGGEIRRNWSRGEYSAVRAQAKAEARQRRRVKRKMESNPQRGPCKTNQSPQVQLRFDAARAKCARMRRPTKIRVTPRRDGLRHGRTRKDRPQDLATESTTTDNRSKNQSSLTRNFQHARNDQSGRNNSRYPRIT